MTGPAQYSPPPSSTPAKSGVGLGALIGVGVAVVLLSFLAAFLGASLAASNDAASNDAAPEPTTTAAPEPTPKSTDEYAEIIEEILPAGSAVRAGNGVPEEGKGYEGDVYIDVATSDVFVFRDGEWVWAGNIRESAAENLTGETGAAGATGPQGEQGAQGDAGAPGTQVLLSQGPPTENDVCESDGDVYIDTDSVTFYECTDGVWAQSGASPGQLPSDQ